MGVVGKGCLKRGNTGLDSPCSVRGKSTYGIGVRAKAIHVFSNGEKISDFSGNVSEWVLDNYNFIKSLSSDYVSEKSGAIKNLFGPEGNYTCTEKNSSCGFGYIYKTSYPPTAIHRGGGRTVYGINHYYEGVFAADLRYDESVFNGHIGFRCTFHSKQDSTPTPDDPDYE